MWLQLKTMAQTRGFALVLTICNAYFCIQSLVHGQWGWAAVSGFFAALCAESYMQRR
jgi:hypothetical protein